MSFIFGDPEAKRRRQRKKDTSRLRFFQHQKTLAPKQNFRKTQSVPFQLKILGPNTNHKKHKTFNHN